MFFSIIAIFFVKNIGIVYHQCRHCNDKHQHYDRGGKAFDNNCLYNGKNTAYHYQPASLFDSSHVVSLSILHEVLTPTTLLRLHFGIILPITMNINPRQQLEITFISMGILSCPSEALMSTSNITN